MSFSYSGDPSDGNVEAVRFLVGDTDSALPLLQDEEIEWLISIWEEKDSVYFWASKAADAIAGKMSREVSMTADSQSLTLSELQQKYQQLSLHLYRQYQDLLASGVELHAGGMLAGEQPDLSMEPLAFGTRMHDIPGGGQQDYGDQHYSTTAAQWGEFTP